MKSRLKKLYFIGLMVLLLGNLIYSQSSASTVEKITIDYLHRMFKDKISFDDERVQAVLGNLSNKNKEYLYAEYLLSDNEVFDGIEVQQVVQGANFTEDEKAELKAFSEAKSFAKKKNKVIFHKKEFDELTVPLTNFQREYICQKNILHPAGAAVANFLTLGYFGSIVQGDIVGLLVTTGCGLIGTSIAINGGAPTPAVLAGFACFSTLPGIISPIIFSYNYKTKLHSALGVDNNGAVISKRENISTVTEKMTFVPLIDPVNKDYGFVAMVKF
ncbi:MAG: hypothetical protein K6E78_05550 [Treponema sp.]|nr:hypothetical protein [Treponema sp.]